MPNLPPDNTDKTAFTTNYDKSGYDKKTQIVLLWLFYFFQPVRVAEKLTGQLFETFQKEKIYSFTFARACRMFEQSIVAVRPDRKFVEICRNLSKFVKICRNLSYFSNLHAFLSTRKYTYAMHTVFDLAALYHSPFK